MQWRKIRFTSFLLIMCVNAIIADLLHTCPVMATGLFVTFVIADFSSDFTSS